jgi:hypothetical protein
MSASEAKKRAAQFLKDQAAIITKYGKSPKLSGPAYKAALQETAKKFQSLTAPKAANL